MDRLSLQAKGSGMATGWLFLPFILADKDIRQFPNEKSGQTHPGKLLMGF